MSEEDNYYEVKMKQTNDFEDKSGGMPLMYMALGVSFFIFVIMGIVIFSNKKEKSSYSQIMTSSSQESSAQEGENDENIYNKDKLTADDLDIWDMYPETEETTKTKEDNKEEKASLETSTTLEDNLDDGKHIKIMYSDGSSEWVTTNPYWEKNVYDYTNLVSNDGKLKYYSDGKKISFLGVDVSRYQKDIDFSTLKNNGIEFVMIRLGARGYKTGALQLDEYFVQNVEGASNAGLDIGIYFYSQAMSQAEAVEEANLVIDNIKDKKITYPIAFDMEFVENDKARVETLTSDERTTISQAFLNRIKESGHIPMVYGNKEWLIKRVDLSKLSDYSIWLSDESDIPDYPYRYEMWQYTKQGDIDGIEGFADLNICFVDYSAR